jgi:hypothetical protein
MSYLLSLRTLGRGPYLVQRHRYISRLSYESVLS